MKKRNRIIIIGFMVLLVVGYIGISYYNSDDAVFNRYLKKITSVERSEIKAIDVHIVKEGSIAESYFDDDKSYLVLDLLNEVKSLKRHTVSNISDNYSTNIRNVFETSDSIYQIRIDINEDNYSFRINELTINLDSKDSYEEVEYFVSNERSVELMRQLLDF